MSAWPMARDAVRITRFASTRPSGRPSRSGRKLGAAVRFIDLPWAEVADDDRLSHRYADAEMRGGAYVASLCRSLGVDDFDALWDEMFEIEAGDDGGPVSRARAYLLRAPPPA